MRPERAVSFYTTVFGWSVNSSEHYTQWGVDGADFGGMVHDGRQVPARGAAALAAVLRGGGRGRHRGTADRAGGTVLMEPTVVPDGPRIAVLRDPQEAVFGVYLPRDER